MSSNLELASAEVMRSRARWKIIADAGGNVAESAVYFDTFVVGSPADNWLWSQRWFALGTISVVLMVLLRYWWFCLRLDCVRRKLNALSTFWLGGDVAIAFQPARAGRRAYARAFQLSVVWMDNRPISAAFTCMRPCISGQ